MTVNDHRPDVPREIVTERLILQAYREDDAEAVIEAIDESRAELEAWMPWPPFMRTPEDVIEQTRLARERWEAGQDFGYGITRREDGRMLGGVTFQDTNWDVPSFEIGYWMRSLETGKGYVREAVIGMLRVAFGTLGARRVQIGCDPDNVRSWRIPESLGFVLEGRLRNDDRTVGDVLSDTLVYALIDTDPAVRDLLSKSNESG